MHEYESAYDTQTESEAGTVFQSTCEMEGGFDEGQEMELASELLTVGNLQELDQFFGKLIRKATKGPGHSYGPVPGEH